MRINPKIANRLTSPVVLFVLAAALAGGVSLVAYMYLQKREQTMAAELVAKSKKKRTVMVDVVVPNRDVPANTVLNNAAFVSRPVESDLVYPDAVLARDFESMQGLRLARPVLRGRPLLMTDLQQPEVRDVATILPKGLRAMTIDIDNLNSIAQTLRPNHRVDIFLLTKAPRIGRNGETDDKPIEQATLFMQNMMVLATGQHFQDVLGNPELTSKLSAPGEVEGSKAPSEFDSVTLLVNPKEAAKLMVGQRMGSFRVVLRGNADREALTLRTTRADEFMPRGAGQRDAGIEFIVGGRGSNPVSRVAVPPSQQIASAMQTALAPLATDGAAAALQAAQAASSVAGQPISAVRNR